MDQSRQHDKSVSHSYLGLPSRYCCDLLPIGVYLHLGYNSICVIVTMRVPNPQRNLGSLHRNLLLVAVDVRQRDRRSAVGRILPIGLSLFMEKPPDPMHSPNEDVLHLLSVLPHQLLILRQPVTLEAQHFHLDSKVAVEA